MPSNTTQRPSGSSGKRRRGGSPRPGSTSSRGVTGGAGATAKTSPPDDTALDDTALDDTALDDTASDDTALDDTASDETASASTGSASATTARKTAAAKTTAAKTTAATATAGKSAAAKTAAGKSAAGTGTGRKPPAGRGAGARPSAGAKGGGRPPGGGKGRRPVKPVQPGKPWGLIALGAVVVLVAAAIIGYGVWYSWDSGKPFGERSAQQIDGMVNYRKTDPDMLTRNHVKGKQTYKVSPPVGGDHNAQWENCEGDVYKNQIPSEHAVHSMEHGAVWITYRPDLPAADVAKLAEKVRGKDYMLMSPYPGLSSPVSVQAWGFQLKVDSVDDERIDTFITQFRRNSNVEPGATCSQGLTVTGTTPFEVPAQSGG